jgi:GNAT superfamily N-acetyltransferase
MIRIARTTSVDQDFLNLVKMLDDELWHRYPEIQHLYKEHARIDFVETVVIAYFNEQPVACGCFLTHDKEQVEVKRMFVHPEHRGKGFATTVLNELEQWARELGYTKSILETGHKQPEAINLYTRSGYQLTKKFGPYIKLEESLCFIKPLV